jgi:hypothetical protein
MRLVLPLYLYISVTRVQTQQTIVKVNDIYTSHFTLPTNTPPIHQPHLILSYP